jgi:hypothetical protein
MGGCRSSAQAIAHPCLSFPHEPAAAAHAIFRGFVGRHDRDAGQDGIVLGCGRLCAAHRRSQSDPSVRTFRGAYIVPVWDKAPAQRVEGHYASFVIAPDYQQVLAWRSIPPERIVMRTALADIHSFDDAIA